MNRKMRGDAIHMLDLDASELFRTTHVFIVHRAYVWPTYRNLKWILTVNEARNAYCNSTQLDHFKR